MDLLSWLGLYVLVGLGYSLSSDRKLHPEPHSDYLFAPAIIVSVETSWLGAN